MMRQCRSMALAAAVVAVAMPVDAGPATLVAQKGDAPLMDAPSDAAQGAGTPWSVQCRDGATKGCRVYQNMVEPETRQRLLTVLIEPVEGEPSFRLALALPHGLYLPAGVRVQIDRNDPIDIVISTSDADGAYAAIAADDALLAAMESGTTMNVSFVAATQQGFSVPVSLAGFAEAMKRIQ